jgi:diguanylate cyclase (GGDEF)-like protein
MTGVGQVRLGARTAFRTVFRTALVWTMGLLLVAYVGGLAVRGLGWGPAGDSWFGPVVDNWVGLAVDWVPAALCWLAVSRVGFRRMEVMLAAVAVTSNAAADSYYTWLLAGAGSVPFPSFADVGYLLNPLLLLVALVVAVRHHSRGLTVLVWLDSVVGSLGAASVLAVVLSPVLAAALTGSLSLATVVAVAYPMSDLLLVAMVAGIAALRGMRMGGRWAVLVVGLLVFAAADVVYALQVTADTYVVGTLLDASWPFGLAMVALWVDATARHEVSSTHHSSSRSTTRSTTGATALSVSAGATAAGLGVLVVASRTHLSTLAVALAGVTLLAAAARSLLAFRLLGRMADQRRRAATTDELTGLPNRRALYAEGAVRLVEPGRRRVALLMLDLDKFKEVNDSLGHHAGDLLLVQVGARLRGQLRAGDVLARLGGDEFAVLLGDAGHDQAVGVAAKLRVSLAESFALEDIALHTSASVGIALFPDDGPDLSALLRKADIAMYKAKASGHGQHVYSSADDANDSIRLQTVEELRTALSGDQFVVFYQPKIDLDTGAVHSVEALVRWDHPTRGLLYPDAFLGLVEESGLMPSLTQVVLALALDQVAIWHGRGQWLTVAVNLSASSLVDADLPMQVASMLAARGVPPRGLQLEITEEFLMADRGRAREILTRLRHSGVQISVDDFGTGYSSLSYLRDLPIDELKLDRSFIFPMADDARAAALVASTIDLAHSLGLRIVAEGVETQLAYTELTRMGCDQAQGYYMSRPVPAAELDQWLSTRHAGDTLTGSPPPRPSKALA